MRITKRNFAFAFILSFAMLLSMFTPVLATPGVIDPELTGTRIVGANANNGTLEVFLNGELVLAVPAPGNNSLVLDLGGGYAARIVISGNRVVTAVLVERPDDNEGRPPGDNENQDFSAVQVTFDVYGVVVCYNLDRFVAVTIYNPLNRGIPDISVHINGVIHHVGDVPSGPDAIVTFLVPIEWPHDVSNTAIFEIAVWTRFLNPNFAWDFNSGTVTAEVVHGNWVLDYTLPPTCLDYGYNRYVCADCGAYKYVPIPPLGHTLGTEVLASYEGGHRLEIRCATCQAVLSYRALFFSARVASIPANNANLWTLNFYTNLNRNMLAPIMLTTDSPYSDIRTLGWAGNQIAAWNAGPLAASPYVGQALIRRNASTLAACKDRILTVYFYAMYNGAEVRVGSVDLVIDGIGHLYFPVYATYSANYVPGYGWALYYRNAHGNIFRAGNAFRWEPTCTEPGRRIVLCNRWSCRADGYLTHVLVDEMIPALGHTPGAEVLASYDGRYRLEVRCITCQEVLSYRALFFSARVASIPANNANLWTLNFYTNLNRNMLAPIMLTTDSPYSDIRTLGWAGNQIAAWNAGPLPASPYVGQNLIRRNATTQAACEDRIITVYFYAMYNGAEVRVGSVDLAIDGIGHLYFPVYATYSANYVPGYGWALYYRNAHGNIFRAGNAFRWEPTCTEPGRRIVLCNRWSCRVGGYLTHVLVDEVIPALGHIPGEQTTVLYPTCSEAGRWEVRCVTCDYLLDYGMIDMLPCDCFVPTVVITNVQGNNYRISIIDGNGVEHYLNITRQCVDNNSYRDFSVGPFAVRVFRSASDLTAIILP